MNLLCHLSVWLEFQPQSLKWLHFSQLPSIFLKSHDAFFFSCDCNLGKGDSELVSETVARLIVLEAQIVTEICCSNVYTS